MSREHTGQNKHPLSTTQEMSLHVDITSPDGQYKDQIVGFLCKLEKLYTVSKKKKRLGADYGSDHELLTAKFRFKLKKVGKTTRPLRYDLNQTPYDYTVEVTNRFKELDLTDKSLKNYGWRFVTLYKRQ